MKKTVIVIEIIFIVFLIGCANKAYYHPSTESFESWRFWTGLILVIELIIGFALSARITGETFGQVFGFTIGSALVAFGIGYIILGEWGIRIAEWLLASTVGKIVLVVLNLFGGIFALFNGTVGTWILNTFHWHSIEVAKWIIIPALIGGVIQIIMLAKAGD